MLALGCDHGGYNLICAIKKYLDEKGIEYKDFGTYSTDSVDYPVYGYKVAKAVASGECELGILCCGTGIGISMAANKVKGARCALCSEEYSARMSRKHNDANVLALGGRVIGQELAFSIVDAYLEEDFEGGRHERRVKKIMEIQDL